MEAKSKTTSRIQRQGGVGPNDSRFQIPHFWEPILDPKSKASTADQNAGSWRALTSIQSQLGTATADTGRTSEIGGRDSRIVRGAIARVQSGDMQALHLLYVPYADDLLRYAKSLVRDHHEAKGITQNVFIKDLSP